MALAAAGVSKSYWGYWFQRPDILAETDSLVTVKHVIPLTTSAARPPQFIGDSSYSKEDAYSSGEDYFLDERHLVQKRSRQAYLSRSKLWVILH